MLSLLGAALVTAGTGAIGFGAAAQLGRRVGELRAMVTALELMERELSFRLTPIPELLDELSRRTPLPARPLFARCLGGLDRLGEESLGQIWTAAVEETLHDLRGEDRAILAELGQVLGRFDGDGQGQAVGQARLRLSHQLEGAERERDSHGRLYGALGVTAGAFFVILLL